MNLKKYISDNKLFINNSLWLYVLQFFNTVVPLISLPYITRILGSSKYGDFIFSLNLIGYLNVIVEYGFELSGTRKVALDKEKKHLQDLESSIMIARFALTVLCYFSMLILIQFFLELNQVQIICCHLLFLSILGTVLQQTWLFQGLQVMHYITIISVVSRIITLILTFNFVKVPEDIFIYCVLYSLSPVLIGFLGCGILICKLKIYPCKISINLIIHEIKDGWYVFTTQLSSKIFSSIGVTFLGFMQTSDIVGIFGAIQKIPNVLLLMWIPVTQVFYPLSSLKWKEDPQNGNKYIWKYGKYFLGIFTLISLIIAIFSKNIVFFVFGSNYMPYHYIIYPLLIWLVIGIANNLLGIQGLLASGRDKEYSKCFQLSVIVSIMSNYFLIKHYGVLGASLAPMISELILFILLLFSYKNISF